MTKPLGASCRQGVRRRSVAALMLGVRSGQIVAADALVKGGRTTGRELSGPPSTQPSMCSSMSSMMIMCGCIAALPSLECLAGLPGAFQ